MEIIAVVVVLVVAVVFLVFQTIRFVQYERQRKAAKRAAAGLNAFYDPAVELRRLQDAGFKPEAALAIMSCVANMRGINEGH